MRLIDKIKTRKAKISVVGLGYVGLPLAVEFARCGFSVMGIEKNRSKVKRIQEGRNYISDVKDSDFKAVVRKGLLKSTDRFVPLKTQDVVVICVPTPLRKTRDPDISHILSAIEEIAKYLHREQLVILESTTYPGTSRELLLPILEKTGLKVGRDFYLVFSPERIDPGNKIYNLSNTPKIVGGITSNCAHIAKSLYKQITTNVIVVSSTEVAEMVKLLENTFRSVNIGLVNEIALICDKLGMDTWEVIEAAASKPFGFMPFYPGPGIGGHCIPVDPHYLTWKLKTVNFYARFIELAGEINSKMPEFLVSKITDALNRNRKSIKDAKILLLGIAYKRDVSDTRESPALDVFRLLRNKGAKVNYNDPYVSRIEIDGKRYISKRITAGTIKSYDCVVIVTEHKKYDIPEIVKRAKLIVDSRNATKGIRSKKIVKL